MRIPVRQRVTWLRERVSRTMVTPIALWFAFHPGFIIAVYRMTQCLLNLRLALGIGHHSANRLQSTVRVMRVVTTVRLVVVM